MTDRDEVKMDHHDDDDDDDDDDAGYDSYGGISVQARKAKIWKGMMMRWVSGVSMVLLGVLMGVGILSAFL
jgi:hypothetical protein